MEGDPREEEFLFVDLTEALVKMAKSQATY